MERKEFDHKNLASSLQAGLEASRHIKKPTHQELFL